MERSLTATELARRLGQILAEITENEIEPFLDAEWLRGQCASAPESQLHLPWTAVLRFERDYPGAIPAALLVAVREHILARRSWGCNQGPTSSTARLEIAVPQPARLAVAWSGLAWDRAQARVAPPVEIGSLRADQRSLVRSDHHLRRPDINCVDERGVVLTFDLMARCEGNRLDDRACEDLAVFARALSTVEPCWRAAWTYDEDGVFDTIDVELDAAQLCASLGDCIAHDGIGRTVFVVRPGTATHE